MPRSGSPIPTNAAQLTKETGLPTAVHPNREPGSEASKAHGNKIPDTGSAGAIVDDTIKGGLGADSVTGEIPIQANDLSKQSTGPQLLRSIAYNATRHDRVCERLPSNVTIALEDDALLGVAREFRGYFIPPGNFSTKTADGQQRKKSAYAMMVSNHKYIDGAIVLADSLRNYSSKVKTGEVEVIILVSNKIRDQSFQQLRYVFDHVYVMHSLSRFSPKSYYTTTFDKAYLFWLEWYELIVFLDADTLALGNPDHLFDKAPQLEKGRRHWISAVGGNDYFQTALLVVRPSKLLFADIYLEYRYGTFGYNQWRARDGILLRNCFMQYHRNIGHPDELHHYYGDLKPWFNKDGTHRHAREPLSFDAFYHMWWSRYEGVHQRFFVDMPLLEGEGPPTYGGQNGKLIQELRKRWTKDGFVAGLPNPGQVTPKDFLWMQRYSGGSEYLRPTAKAYERFRNLIVEGGDPGLVVILPGIGEANPISAAVLEAGTATAGEGSVQVGKFEPEPPRAGVAVTAPTDCETACKAKGLACDDRGFSLTSINSCVALEHVASRFGFTCEGKCEFRFQDSTAPLIMVQDSDLEIARRLHGGGGERKISTHGNGGGLTRTAVKCFQSFLHDPVFCNASVVSSGKGEVPHRICPCVSKLGLALVRP
jgi:hypothetical protein